MRIYLKIILASAKLFIPMIIGNYRRANTHGREKGWGKGEREKGVCVRADSSLSLEAAVSGGGGDCWNQCATRGVCLINVYYVYAVLKQFKHDSFCALMLGATSLTVWCHSACSSLLLLLLLPHTALLLLHSCTVGCRRCDWQCECWTSIWVCRRRRRRLPSP